MPNTSQVQNALRQPGRFSILLEIDQGENAFAFKAHDRLLGRDVFLKIIYYSPEVASDLLREPRVLVQATQHDPKPENLVQVFGAEIIDVAGEQHLCLQMEWLEGSSLLSALAEGAIGQLDAVRIARGILHGVSHLHFCRILHRDLKPANILLDGKTPKIADFGSAAVLPEGATAIPASRHSALYVPPEGWGAAPYYSKASDIYQVGMVLYELANGPIDSQLRHYLTPKVLRELRATGRDYNSLDDCDKSQLADKGIAQLSSQGGLLLHGRPQRPYYSSKLRRIVNAATKPDPGQRYASAGEFISKLNQIDIPNWLPTGDAEFLADNWRGWDWTVSFEANRVAVRKAQPGTTKFRRIPNSAFSSLADAFLYVEEQ
jgi:serine/threonine protein kinase